MIYCNKIIAKYKIKQIPYQNVIPLSDKVFDSVAANYAIDIGK